LLQFATMNGLASPDLADKSRRDEEVYCITKTVMRVKIAR
jgi:hypothetical protein